MRLVNGGSSLEGRLEVCLNGVWGTICDTSWDDTDAGVACSQMGYSGRGSIYQGYICVVQDDMQCREEKF